VNGARQAGRGNGKALFLWHTVRTLLSYRFQEVTVSVDEAEPVAARMALVAVANGPRFGGGMLVAPDARPDDGLLDIVMLAGIGKFRLLRDIGQVYRGAHRNHPAVTILRGRKVAVLPGEGERAPVLLDIDGESPGRLPATFEILPGALTLAG
jgi:diacylglycerol kinase family enzyme